MFDAAPATAGFAAMERETLQRWQRDGIFEKLREKNRGGSPFSFIDGPMTANNPMAVHHAWGRTYKDLFQRYRAMEGDELRYQNGFDCQGLWVEVEVEKELGLNSKREILDYGLDGFALKCRERVRRYAAIQTEQSKRLGQWMDWDNSYYTMTNGNIEHIWHFLKICREKGWLYAGHRVMPWCARCGTSLSQHELADSYKDMEHRSVYALFPMADSDESLLVWTTTPWTLPANTGVAVHPDLEYALFETGAGPVWMASDCPMAARGRMAPAEGEAWPVIKRAFGRDLAGLAYEAPFADLPASRGVRRRVVVWDMVGGDEGSGLVHIAPGCGAEDYDLGKSEGLAVLTPIDESGCFLAGYGPFSGTDVKGASKMAVKLLKEKGRLFKEESHKHRYPTCWRCGEELVFRLVDEWFISASEIREPMRKAAAGVHWIPEHAGKRMDDWLLNMGDWCISRKRFWGLPLPFYKCEACGKLMVVGSVEELRERAVEPELVVPGLELHRPWIDGIALRCDECGHEAKRVPEVGDCWLDAGIVPFSTLGYLDGDKAYWRKWFPADFVCEMREQIRLWFYAQLFMSVTLTGVSPYRKVLVYEKVNDEKGRPMHKSGQNAIWLDDAAERMGVDVMRWIYASRNPSQNLNFGYTLADEVRRRLLTVWNVYSFLVTYGRIDRWQPEPLNGRDPDEFPAVSEVAGLPAGFTAVSEVAGLPDGFPAASEVAGLPDGFSAAPKADSLPDRFSAASEAAGLPDRFSAALEVAGLSAASGNGDLPEPSVLLDSWMVARTKLAGVRVREALDSFDAASMVRELDEFIEDMSNWYVRRNRRRFWKSGSDGDKKAGYATLHWTLLTFCRLAAPLLPFVTEAMYRNLSKGMGLPESVHLCGYPKFELTEGDMIHLRQMELVRKVAALGLAARNEARIRVRQPLRTLFVDLGSCGDALPPGAGEILSDELNVKSVAVSSHPNALCGKEGELSVRLDLALDDKLLWEGYARDLVRQIQSARKKMGLAVESWISLELFGSSEAVDGMLPSLEYVKAEVLAQRASLSELPEGYDMAEPANWEDCKCGDQELRFRISKV